MVDLVTLDTREDQEAVFIAIYSKLLSDTKAEMRGVLTNEGIIDNLALRSVLKRLAIVLGKVETYSPIDWLRVGIPEFIPREKLHEWANPTKAPHWTEEDFHKLARHLEGQLQD